MRVSTFHRPGTSQWHIFAFLSTILLKTCAGDEETKPKCGIYLAPSSIPGAGLGMYAGDKHFKRFETVTLGDTVVPISEYDWNNENGPYEQFKFLFDEYTWNSPVFPGMEDEGDDEDLIMVASPGIGSAANSYISLVNIDDHYIKVGRAVGPDSPGIGANSLYYGREFFATKDIPPGGEIFVDYGAGYFKSRRKIYGYIPLPESFAKTDELLRKYLKMKKRITSRGGNQIKSNELWKDYYDVILSVGPAWKKSRVLNGLPEEEEKIPIIMREGGSRKQHYNRSIADVAWLEQNGQCMDNIKVGNSTNPDAGRGAFANRFIPEGGLVAPAPLIHIRNFNAMKVFLPKDHEKDPGKLLPDRDGPFVYQLLLNYCFGHEKSTLLLCPYGLLTSFINHSHKTPNTRIQWSKEMRHPDWLEKPFEEWTSVLHTGLQIDFVALRDIEEDEEILIDYGASWEAAWQEHVKKFVPHKEYVPSFELNEMEDLELRTAEDEDYEVHNVTLMCRGWYVKQFVERKDNDAEVECRVLKKLGDDSYLVQIMEVTYFDEERYMEVLPGRILWNVPRDALYFADLPYTRDHYDLQSFRHAMMIPDDIFPEVWKNME